MNLVTSSNQAFSQPPVHNLGTVRNDRTLHATIGSAHSIKHPSNIRTSSYTGMQQQCIPVQGNRSLSVEQGLIRTWQKEPQVVCTLLLRQRSTSCRRVARFSAVGQSASVRATAAAASVMSRRSAAAPLAARAQQSHISRHCAGASPKCLRMHGVRLAVLIYIHGYHLCYTPNSTRGCTPHDVQSYAKVPTFSCHCGCTHIPLSLWLPYNARYPSGAKDASLSPCPLQYSGVFCIGRCGIHNFLY